MSRGGYPPRGRGGDRGGFRGGGRGGPPGGGFQGGGRGAGITIFSSGTPANLDPRLADSEQNSLISSLKNLSLRTQNQTVLPVRPGWGTSGTVIKLRANFYPFRDLPERDIYEFDVAIEPSLATKRRLRKRVFQLIEEAPEYTPIRHFVAHDSSAILYSARPIQGNTQPLQIRVVYRDEDQDQPAERAITYEVTIKYVKTLNTGDLNSFVESRGNHDIQPLLSALNVILSQVPSRTGVMVGGDDKKSSNRANKFFFPDQVTPMIGGLQAWRGFYTSVRPVYKTLMVNVNVATTAFYEPLNMVQAMDRARSLVGPRRLSSYYFGLRVSTNHLNHPTRKTIRKIMDKGSEDMTFSWEEKGKKPVTVTVAYYFKTHHNLTLAHPKAPVIDVGTQKRPVYLPPEICQIIPGQVFRGKLADEHTAEMIRVAAKPPHQNAAFIQNVGLTALGFTPNNGILQQFNLNIGREMTVVPGRILPPPSILYGGNKTMRAENASWNLRDIKFQVGAVLDTWAVLNLRDGGRDDFDSPESLKAVVLGFMSMLSTLGMKANQEPKYINCQLPGRDPGDPGRNNAIAAIEGTMRKLPAKPKLLFVMLSNPDKTIYNGIKYLCDVRYDIHCVCVQVSKFRKEKGQPQYFANVALKFNMKLGGINHGLHPDNLRWLNQKPTMIVGMDVTHPGPGALKGAPSIAAIVASTDNRFAQYPASLRIQEPKKEMISELAKMMAERLQTFRNTVRRLPDRILVFRDGVSEGQYDQVVQIEFPALLEGCRSVDPKYRPKVTIVVCGKRHHTRFYPTSEADADRTSNTKAGTVVDRGVTTVYNFDFYLQAHAGLQGSVRPTHYVVVVDENGFGADDIQRLTHDTSYMFARATKGVSLVSPAYYADIACERGRCYLHDSLSGSDGMSSSGTLSEDAVYKNAIARWARGPGGPNIRNSMFYL